MVAFAPVAHFAALRAHLTQDQYAFVTRVFRTHPIRSGELMLEGGVDEVTPEEFARYCLRVATRVHREIAS